MNNSITVIIPYRNAEKYISRTLETVLTQTYNNFELLCVDNGSTDYGSLIVTNAILRDGGDCFSGTIRNLTFPTQGKSLALNHAITQATGEWIAICDADDLWHEEKLEKQFKCLTETNDNRDIIGTQMWYIDEDENDTRNAPTLPVWNDDIRNAIFRKKDNPICNSSVLYRKSIHLNVVGFYDPLCTVEDYDLWSRCAFAGLNFHNLDEQLVAHRIHDASNFNSSRKQLYHKQLVDAKIDAYNSIEEALAEKK